MPLAARAPLHASSHSALYYCSPTIFCRVLVWILLNYFLLAIIISLLGGIYSWALAWDRLFFFVLLPPLSSGAFVSPASSLFGVVMGGCCLCLFGVIF